jgi:glycosyltransferase involved in cell wall biosynthesis
VQTAAVCPAPVLVSLDSALAGQDAPAQSLAVGVLRSADWVTCVSAASLAQARAVAPEIGARSSVVYKGPARPGVPPLPLPLDGPRLLCVGRLVPVKGFDLALRAFAQVLPRFPGARLVVAGDGPARGELERLAGALSVGSRVRFEGWVDPGDVPRLMNAATVVVISSRREGLPQVSLESGLMARPVVATRVGGLPEVVVHGRTGLLVEPESPAALADGIASVLADPGRAARMGRAARARVLDVFGWERTVDAYDALYRRLAVPRAS